MRTLSPGTGQELERRQWFLLYGLVPLSSPDGGECGGAGLAYADSELSGTDILIDIGLQVGAALVGTAVCNLPDNPTADDARNYSSCVGAVSALGGIIGSRTVTYQCAGQAAPMPRVEVPPAVAAPPVAPAPETPPIR